MSSRRPDSERPASFEQFRSRLRLETTEGNHSASCVCDKQSAPALEPDSLHTSQFVESPGTSECFSAGSSSFISSDEVVALPTSLQPVRTSPDRRCKRRPGRRVLSDYRTSCVSGLVESVCACWMEWTRDPDPALANRFFFQDQRPRDPFNSPGWPMKDWFDVDKSLKR